jgi:heavy metal sensor kinase
MITSFRLRLAVLSALLSGLTLGASGFAAWWLIRDLKLDRLDHEVRASAEREVSRNRSFDDWQRIEAGLNSGLGVRGQADILLLVAEAGGTVVYRSPHWPADLDVGTLPWPVPDIDGPIGASPPVGAVDARTARPPRPERPGTPAGPPPPSVPDGFSAGPPPVSIAVSRTIGKHLWQFGLASNGSARVAVGADTDVIDADMRGIRNAILSAMPLALVLISLGAWIFSTRAMRPLRKLIAAAQQVSARKLDQRIPYQGEDREFTALIDVFNAMLERLERSFNQAQRFSVDAAHELKTPLAIVQGQLERSIAMAEAGSSMQSDLSSVLDEVRRLSTISRKLLLLSQADAGRLNVHREPFDLSKVLVELIEDIHMLAPHLRVTSNIQSEIIVHADSDLLRQILHNLVSNSIKYNVADGWIRISLEASRIWAGVSIINPSSEIPLAERDRLFERFFRADLARNRRIDGVGLGLSVSREIARAHGGDIACTVNDHGTVEFTLRLPLGPPP